MKSVLPRSKLKNSLKEGFQTSIGYRSKELSRKNRKFSRNLKKTDLQSELFTFPKVLLRF